MLLKPAAAAITDAMNSINDEKIVIDALTAELYAAPNTRSAINALHKLDAAIEMLEGHLNKAKAAIGASQAFNPENWL